MSRNSVLKSTDTNKDHIYYNIKIHNDGIDDTNIPIYFNENRSSALVEVASDYYCSIIRFNLETTNLPVLLLRPDTSIITNPTQNINQLVYTLSLSADNFKTRNYIHTKHVIFVPEINNNLTIPTIFEDRLKFNSYYYLYNIQTFILQLNLTFKTIFNEMKTQYTTNLVGIEPKFTFDAITGLITFKHSTNVFNGNTSICRFAVNHSLYSVLSGFQFSYYKQYPDEYIIEQSNFKRNPTFDDIGIGATNTLKALTQDPYELISTQDYPSISILNPVSSIAFSSSRLPIHPTQEGAPLVVGGTSLYGTNSGENNGFSPIINDFSVYNENGYAYKPSVYYTPSSEYKLNDLFGQNPINHIDILCDWVDIYGNKHPMFLESQNSAEIQLLFRKKTFQTLKKL